MESGQKAVAAHISPVRAHAAAESRVAAVLGSDSAQLQVMFAELARLWQRRGIRVVGVVEKTRGATGNACGDPRAMPLILRGAKFDPVLNYVPVTPS
jgi:hypothetical protein